MELTRPFAENGERQDFAIETQSNGEMSLQQGFGPLYSQSPESGGLFIDRAKFNQLMYLTTKGVLNSPKNFIGDLELVVGDGPNEIKTLDEALIKSKEINAIGNMTKIILKKDVVWSIEIHNINVMIISENENDKKTITFKKRPGFKYKMAYVGFTLSRLWFESVMLRVDESNGKADYVLEGAAGRVTMMKVDVHVNQSQVNNAFCAGGNFFIAFCKFTGILKYFCWVGGGGSYMEVVQSTFENPCVFNIREGGIAVTGNIAGFNGNIAKNTLTPQGVWFFDTTI